jgi:hypothetical protein
MLGTRVTVARSLRVLVAFVRTRAGETRNDDQQKKETNWNCFTSYAQPSPPIWSGHLPTLDRRPNDEEVWSRHSDSNQGPAD